MKWVGTFQVGIFWVGIFRGGEVSRGSLMGGNFRVEIFPGGVFLEPFRFQFQFFQYFAQIHSLIEIQKTS